MLSWWREIGDEAAQRFHAELVERGLSQLVLSCVSQTWHSAIAESISCPKSQAQSIGAELAVGSEVRLSIIFAESRD